MAKHKYVEEFEINASPKILYPYLDSPSGLQEWFCSKVNLDEDKLYNFIWDGQNHFARKTYHRTNKSVRFHFLDDHKQEVPDANYLDFYIETSELTQGLYLRVTDYSEEDDQVELHEMWQNLVMNLRALMGG